MLPDDGRGPLYQGGLRQLLPNEFGIKITLEWSRL